MAAQTMLALVLTTALLLLVCSEVGADRPIPAPSPVSDHIGLAVTATKEMARDVANSAAPKAGEVAQAVKDTAKSAADSVTPTVNKAGDAAKDAAESAKEMTASWASWFKHKLGNLGIIRGGPAEPTNSPSSAPTGAPTPAPVKMPRVP